MKGLKIGVIGIPGKWSTEVLADALQQRTGFRDVIDMANLKADLDTASLWNGDTNLCEFEGLVVKKISQNYSPNTLDRIELLRIAESSGVRVFSPAETIIRMIDRLSCTVTLRNGGIPMPETVVTESEEEAFSTVQQFGEAVFKPLFSTKARGMKVLQSQFNDSKVRRDIAQFQSTNPMMYIQKKVDLPGRDFGMVFLGGSYLGSYARIPQDDAWNTTIESGGKYAKHTPPDSTIDLATHAQSLFKMDFTTVDVADTPEGPVVFEVSAFGGFQGAEDGIGIDAASLYADYIVEELQA